MKLHRAARWHMVTVGVMAAGIVTLATVALVDLIMRKGWHV